MVVESLWLAEIVHLDFFVLLINVFQNLQLHQAVLPQPVDLKIVVKKPMDVEDLLIAVHVKLVQLAKNMFVFQMCVFHLQHVLQLIPQISFQSVEFNQMVAIQMLSLVEHVEQDLLAILEDVCLPMETLALHSQIVQLPLNLELPLKLTMQQ